MPYDLNTTGSIRRKHSLQSIAATLYTQCWKSLLCYRYTRLPICLKSLVLDDALVKNLILRDQWRLEFGQQRPAFELQVANPAMLFTGERTMNPRILGLAMLGTTLLSMGSLAYANESISKSIGLADLQFRSFVVDIVDANPGIKAARMTLVSKSAARDADSQSLYNPDFLLSAEDTGTSMRSVGISQSLDWSGKRKLRAQVADIEFLFVEAEFVAIRRMLMGELLKGLAQHHIGLERYAVVLDRQRLMNDLVNIAQSRLAAGDISQVELDLVKLAASNARILSIEAQANQLDSRRAVQSLTRQSYSVNWPTLPDTIPELPTSLDTEELVQQLPEALMAMLSVQKNDSLTKLSRAERRPDPTVSLEGGKEDGELLVGLNVTIPLFVRNSFKHEVNSVQAERSASELRADDVLHRARVRLSSATERFGLLRTAWIEWETTSKENLSRPVEQLKRLWETGEMTTTDYVVQLSETLAAKESALDLRESVWLAWFEWLLAAGQIDAWLGVNP